MTTETKPGKLWGLGVGPGDPELITLKAYRILRDADLIAYPAPENGESFARAIVAAHLDGQPAEYPIRMPMVAERFPAQAVYDTVAEELSARVRSGARVAVLCEGDPFFYGSFMYLFGRLAERVPMEVVPGVSALTAGSASLGAPLVSRNDALTVVPAPLDAATLRDRLAATEAAAIVKVGRHFPKVQKVLADLGRIDDARYVERATLANERVRPVAEMPAEPMPYFAVILTHVRGLAWL